jgi:ABC-2 type transport system permease protein/oleandomycin transport system permease protein
MSSAPAVTNRLPRGAAIADALVVARRNVRHLVRTPQLIVFSVVQTVLFLLLFKWVFGGSIAIPGLSYVDYLIPAFLCQIAIFDGFGVAIGLAEDAKSGLIERFRALPMARSAFVTGRATADLLRQVALLGIVLGIGYLLGFHFHNGALSVIAAFGLAVLFGFAMFWLFAMMGLLVRDSETAQAATTPFFLFTFLSTGFIRVDRLPGWLQPFARNQPVSMVTNAIRGLTQGHAAARLVEHSTSYYVTASIIWCAALVVVFAPLAVYAYRRP